MQKSIWAVLIFLSGTMLLVAGCTSPASSNATPVATPTPQIVYVTVLVTPVTTVANQSLAAAPEATESSESLDIMRDEAFLDYIDGNQIFEAMTALEGASPGSYSISTGYNAKPREEADRLTALIYKAPKPGSEKMKAYRSALMDALAEMDGTTAGFSRYRDAMEKVILVKNAAESEMHSAGSSLVDAIRLNGHGDDVRSFNVTETGLHTFTLHHTGDHNFAITLKDDDGKYIALLVNEIGDYSGKNSEKLAIGRYWLNIEADGDWAIAITSG
jgi:hypothetical protein